MTDTQILTLAVTLSGVFAGSWFSNSRIGDLNIRIGDVDRNLSKRLEDTKEVLRAEMTTRFDLLENAIKRNQETVMRMLADQDQRLSKLEGGTR